MADKKSILEEALLDIKNIQSALNANTKEILRSVAREEIDGVVKESLTREVYEEEEVGSVNEESHEEHEAGESEKEEKAEHGKGGSEKKEKAKSKKMTEGMDTEGMEAEGMTYEEGMDDLGASEELDMTSASDDDVIAIYKKLSGDDEIEIVGDEIHLSVSEPGEYVIKTSDLKGSTEMEPEMEPEMGDEEGDVDYEIEMGDEEDGEEPTDLMSVDDEEGEEEEEEEESEEEPIEEKISIGTNMSVGTHRGKGPKSIGAPENPKSITEATKKLVSETTKKYNLLLTEASKLRAENQEFRTALKEFRTKLVETVVFNSNLTYVTKLFTEHATTKVEKQNIIKRFDEDVLSLKESKKLYKTIVNELETRKPISESVENKIIKEATTSSSRQLNESTAYVDPSTKRILDLINRVERK
jgi:hypothetical protein